jgi:hypothetical protein
MMLEPICLTPPNDCFEMRVEDSGLMERLATLIESVESR